MYAIVARKWIVSILQLLDPQRAYNNPDKHKITKQQNLTKPKERWLTHLTTSSYEKDVAYSPDNIQLGEGRSYIQLGEGHSLLT